MTSVRQPSARQAYSEHSWEAIEPGNAAGSDAFLKRSKQFVNAKKLRIQRSAPSNVNAFNFSICFANDLLAVSTMGPSRPWSDRYLFSVFNAFQQLSIRFNTLQHDSTSAILTVLKRVEQLTAVTFRTSLEGRSTRSGGRESQGVKRSVRVQAFTCSRSLAG